MTEVQNTAGEIVALKSGWRLPLPLVIAGLALLLWIYLRVFALLVFTWLTDSDYSHSLLVPCFSAYLLWSNRSQLRDAADQPAASGLVFGAVLLTAALLLRFAGIVLNSHTVDGLSFVTLVMGLATIKWGRPAISWASPAILFLIFMIPLPYYFTGQLDSVLQTIVTKVGTFALQTLGVPALSEGNKISLTHGQIDVAEGCRGIYSFFALTVGACLIVDRTWIEKIVIAISAIPIGIAAHSLGIVATGVAYQFADPATADYIFVDVTGWAMLPLSFFMLLGVLAIVDRAFERDE